MTGFWAKMLIFNEYKEGNITKGCAERFVSLIEKHEFKDVEVDRYGYAKAEYNSLSEIYKGIAEDAAGRDVHFKYSGNFEKTYNASTEGEFTKEEMEKQGTRDLIKLIADNIHALSFEQGYRVGDNTVYLESLLGEETPHKFVDKELDCEFYDNDKHFLNHAYTKFDFDKPLDIDEKFINSNTLNDIATITDYLKNKVRWQKTGDLRDYYEKRYKRFIELENKCQKFYEEHYGDMHGF